MSDIEYLEEELTSRNIEIEDLQMLVATITEQKILDSKILQAKVEEERRILGMYKASAERRIKALEADVDELRSHIPRGLLDELDRAS